MKISFIIPAYNEGDNISSCLQSILKEGAQAKYDFEIIVVNNASTDNTREIAAGFPGVKVVDEPIKGLTRARQAGFTVASGELIANVDADTMLPPGWLKTVYKEFEKNPKLVALSGPFIYHDLSKATNVLVRIFYGLAYGSYIFNRFILRVSSMLQGGNFVIRRSALEEIGGFNLKITFYGEDTDIAKRLHRLGAVKWTFALPMHASGRRLAHEGILKIGWRYALNYLWVIFFKKPFTENYIDIRKEQRGLRIAIFSENFYPELSGISDSVIALAIELAAHGNAVDFFVPRYSAKDYATAGLAPKELELGANIRIHRWWSLPVPAPTKQGRMIIPTGLRWLSIKKYKPDIIHSQLFFGAGIEALLAAKILHKPLVGTNHTAISEFIHWLPLRGKWLEKLSLKYVSWYYNRCDFVSAPSESVFVEMIQHGLAHPHHVISNPIDLEEFMPPAGENEKSILKKEFALDGPVMIYAGRLAPEKNIETILHALPIVKKSLPKFTLLVAGHGNYAQVLRKLAAKLGVAEEVRFLGTLDKPRLSKALRASDLFVIMSESETQSMTLMQAMASGLPVIGARARALPEYINDQNGLLCDSRSYEQLAEKMLLLLQDQKLRAALGKGALNFVQDFSAAAIGKKWQKQYSAVLERFNASAKINALHREAEESS